MIADEQEWPWGRGREDRFEELHAVRVAPLEVVDVHDEGAVLGDRAEKVLESGEAAATHLDGVGDILAGVVRVGHACGVAQDRKQARERVHARGQEIVRLLLVEPREPPTELIDDLVDGLEGDGLALVAAPGEDEHVGARGQGAEEARGQGALSHARAALQHHDDRLGLS